LFWWFAETDRTVGALFMGAIRRRGCGSGFSLFGVVDLALAAAAALSFSRDRSSVGFEYR